jgi:hypothetical protein
MKYTGIESIDERIEKKIEAAKEREYFVPRELDECNKLIPELEKIVKDYKDALKPWYTTSWDTALGAAVDVAINAARSAAALSPVWDPVWNDVWNDVFNRAYDDARNAARGAAFGAARNAALAAAVNVGFDATWERDIKGYENNPFEIIVKMYDMGLYPRGFKKVDGIEKFIVDTPLKTSEGPKLGCWAEGDEEILHWHRWDEDCSEIRPVKPLRIIK